MFDIRALLIAIAASLAFGFTGGWVVHGWQMKASQLNAVTSQAHQVVAVTHKQDRITAKVEGADAKKQQQIRVVYRALQQQVPIYVTPEVDRQYPVSDRLVGVLDRALDVPDIPNAAGQPHDAAPGASAVTESDLGSWGTAVIETCNSTRQQLIDLQAWIQAQSSGRIPKEVAMVDWMKHVEDGLAHMVGGVLIEKGSNKELGRLKDGEFVAAAGVDTVEHPAQPLTHNESLSSPPGLAAVQAAVAADPAVAEDVALAGGPAVVAAAAAEPPAQPQAQPERPAVDASAMLGD